MDDRQKKLIELDQKYIMNTYARSEAVLVGGRNATVVDLSGNTYIDFTSGIGVNSLGFCNKDWCKAVTGQVMALQHVSNLYYTVPDAQLAAMLCERTGYHRVFFSNSGAEANEGAVKVARSYGYQKHGENCYKILTLCNSFHGRTLTTLAATGQEVFHQKFLPLTPGFDYVIANDIADLKAKVDDTVCAIMLEFVQGEGGVIPLDKDFVAAVAEICAEKDILMIADEVQTGVGRTSTFLASEQYDVTPDITTLAKGLGGGLPIGAVLVGEKCDLLSYGDHGSTYGGNPVACAGAKVVLELIDDDLLEAVHDKGVLIRNLLSDCEEIASIDGLGLMLGIALKDKKAAEVRQICMERGLLVLTAKDKVRLLPPLTISQDELRKGIAILKQVLES